MVTTLLVSFAEKEEEEGERTRGVTLPSPGDIIGKGQTRETDRQTDDKSGLIQLDMYSHVTLKENLHVQGRAKKPC